VRAVSRRAGTLGRALPPGDAIRASFDHLVGGGEQRRGQFDSQRPGCLQIDDGLELRRLLEREIAGFRALEDFVDEGRGFAKQLWENDRVSGQTPAARIDRRAARRQPIFERERREDAGVARTLASRK